MLRTQDTEITFEAIGLFKSESEWTHPEVCEKTYEIIYVTEGNVYLSEGEKNFELEKGDIIVLRPGVFHKGSKTSVNTSFYWVHFSMKSKLQYETSVIKGFTKTSLFKELMHYSHLPLCPDFVRDSALWHLLAEISMCSTNSNVTSLGQNIFEWTRINISRNLTVKKVADNFGYNSEYISRLIKNQFGITLKALIDKFLLDKAKDYLSNTNYTVKEIGNFLGFNSSDAFINFYKYHESISPNKYRNSYTSMHMNKR